MRRRMYQRRKKNILVSPPSGKVIAVMPKNITIQGGGSPSPAGLYWGGSIGGDQYGYAGQAYPWGVPYETILADFVSGAGGGKNPTVVDLGAIWRETDGVTMSPFPATNCTRIITDGIIPHITWQSTQRGQQNSASQPDFKLTNITSGAFDSYITQWATDAKNWGHPLFLRLDQEMNGNWFTWGVGINGNVVGDFAPFWRHVRGIFDSVGASNVTWVWCVNFDPGLPSSYFYQNYSTMYPGDAYVDWVSMDGYNYGSVRSQPWRTFTTLYQASYNALASIVGATKPFIISEIGCSYGGGGDKAAWITDAYNQVRTNFPRFRAIMYYNIQDAFNTYIETDTASTSAFAAGVANSQFLAGGTAYSSLPFEKVPVPS